MQIDYKHTLSFDGGWDPSEVAAMLSRSKDVAIVAHTNADGDAVGAVTGMYAILTGMGKQVTAILPDGVPDELAWLPHTAAIVDGKTQEARCRAALAEADLIVGLDISSPTRIGNLEEALRNSKARKLLVDHHECPEREAFDMVVSEPEASSTCELIYWVMRQAFGRDVFSAPVATSLYTGICTDTGTFAYSNRHPSLYLAAAELVGCGIDPMAVNHQIKNVFTEARLRFFGFAMAHRLTVYAPQRVALMVLTAQDMREAGVESSELTGLINEVMKLKAVDCSILVREEEGKVRLSLRSKEQYDVNRLARELFGGGGHQRAAGATSTVSLGETVTIVKQRLGLK